MRDKIIKLDDDTKYLILDETEIDNKSYYYALCLDDNEEKMDSYLFFEENNKMLIPVINDKLRDMLMTTFTINYIDKVYDYGEV